MSENYSDFTLYSAFKALSDSQQQTNMILSSIFKEMTKKESSSAERAELRQKLSTKMNNLAGGKING